MSAAPEQAPAPSLEVVWQPDATAYVFTRDADGTLSSGHLLVGMPAITGHGMSARRVDVTELVALAAKPPPSLSLGGTASATFAVVELARRSVTEGLVHPQLESDGRRWYAHWAATIDDSIEQTLAQIAVALPAVSAAPFDGDRDAAVNDLYAFAVDRIARERLRRDRVRLGLGVPGALGVFLDGLTAAEPELLPHSGYPALERRLSRWVDEGLERLSPAPWQLGLRLTESLALELWLQAEDDPSLSLPVSLLWEDGGGEVFAFLRASDPRKALARQLTEIEPLLADAGIEFEADEPFAAQLDDATVKTFLRGVSPQLAE